MEDVRMIERWLPIAALGEESARERRSMTALPPTYYLHVWWARRPLVASRAAILASLLPADANRETFLHVLGIHGDPVATRRLLDRSKRTGENLGLNPYGYSRAFQYMPVMEDREWIAQQLGRSPSQFSVLDPTAGGGSIPFEALRLGFASLANDLNPVAVSLLRATVDLPASLGPALLKEFKDLCDHFLAFAANRFDGIFPPEPVESQVFGYLFARTITCPYCDGLVPLSPNWRLSSDGTGVRVLPQLGDGPGSQGRACHFEIVNSVREQSDGTVAGGDGLCPYSDCARVIDGDEIKHQAQAGKMGEQLYTVAYKRRAPTGTKRVRWVRGFRAPRPEDDNSAFIQQRLAERMPDWEALGAVPTEAIPEGLKTTEPLRYGMHAWRDLFSPRQLLCHATSVGIFREMVDADRTAGTLNDLRKAAYLYLALSLDTMLNYGNRSCRWDVVTERVRSIFDRHDFAFCWSYSEMAPLITGLGYDWAFEKTAKCIQELVELVTPQGAAYEGSPLFSRDEGTDAPPVTITCQSAEGLDHVADGSIDAIVIDPPYYDNVMYAELSDFFYVWLKRTAGYVDSSLFRRALTDKEQEAVANPARYKGEKGAKQLAGRDYQERMGRIFAECRRVLKPNGIMTLMFTHKATGAWDALTTGLMEAGFRITASWPINTEAEGSLHIKDKAAANSTIFLACRPRPNTGKDAPVTFWEDVEPRVAAAVRKRVEEFKEAGIGGVDLYLASFGPALEEFSRHWPIRRGRPRAQEQQKKRQRQAELFKEEFDPYKVLPEDALDAARREVKRWRLEQLTQLKGRAELDPLASFFVLAWDAFKAPKFDYDEGLRLARAVGVDLEAEVVGVIADKKQNTLILWDSSERAARHALGSSASMLNTVHLAAWLGRSTTLESAREMIVKEGLDGDASFHATLKAVLEVLPVSQTYSMKALESKELEAAASDFEALEGLRRLAFEQQVAQPEQLNLALKEAEEIKLAAVAAAAAQAEKSTRRSKR